MRHLSAWLDHIAQIHQTRIELGLDRIAVVRERMALVLPGTILTVGGTNGKGSCVRALECIYLEAGYSVAAYTSPHLISFTERLRLNDAVLADALWCAAFSAVEAARGDVSLSFFEFTTLAAFWLIQQHDVDIVLLEVGLGGRLDAVNIIDPAVALLTSIDLDHQSWLGETRDAIGQEKAGIFRAGRPAVVGDLDPPASVLAQASALGATLYCAGRDFKLTVDPQDPMLWTWESFGVRVERLTSPGIKPQNAATALMAVTTLQSERPVSEAVIRRGLLKARLPGRFEVRDGPPVCILDVAHNPASAAYLAVQLRQAFPGYRFVAVFGMLGDKAMPETVQPMLELIFAWYVADLAVPRGAKAAQLAGIIREKTNKSCYTFSTVSQALTAAQRAACPGEPIAVVVFGSFHTVGEASLALRAQDTVCEESAIED